MNVLPMMSRFSAWAYDRVYDSCAGLSDVDYRLDRCAFFGSIHNTLNHLLVVDRLFLGRLEGSDYGITGLDQILHDDFAALRAAQKACSLSIIELVAAMPDAAFSETFAYRRMVGGESRMLRGEMLMTMFNHQTHHRGQVTALLSQAEAAYGALDIVYFLAEQN